MTKAEIDRINELAAKSRTEEGLSDEEKAQQASLRQAYITSVKASLRTQLENTEILEPDGSITKLKK